MGKRVRLFTFAAAALLLAAALIHWLGPGKERPFIDPGDADSVVLGETIYAHQCAACHGENLQGQPDWRRRRPDGRLPAPPHDDSGHTWHHSDAVLFDITKNGLVPGRTAPPGYQSDMPAYGERLSDEEIRAVLAYIKSRWSPESRALQDEVNRQSRDP